MQALSPHLTVWCVQAMCRRNIKLRRLKEAGSSLALERAESTSFRDHLCQVVDYFALPCSIYSYVYMYCRRIHILSRTLELTT